MSGPSRSTIASRLIALESALRTRGSRLLLRKGPSKQALLDLIRAMRTEMGKAGFQELKQHIYGYMSSMVPSAEVEVGPMRHRIGLVMFCLPLISSFLEPYIDAVAPGLRPNNWMLQMLGDAMLIGSFFVLGGNFWEKLRALYQQAYNEPWPL